MSTTDDPQPRPQRGEDLVTDRETSDREVGADAREDEAGHRESPGALRRVADALLGEHRSAEHRDDRHDDARQQIAERDPDVGQREAATLDPRDPDPVRSDPVRPDPVRPDPADPVARRSNDAVRDPSPRDPDPRDPGRREPPPASTTDPRDAHRPDHGGDELATLIPRGRSTEYRDRWESLKATFVDDPRTAVHGADALVGEVLDELEELFRRQRSELDRDLHDDQASTEDLRIALSRYRSFFDRLLSL